MNAIENPLEQFYTRRREDGYYEVAAQFSRVQSAWENGEATDEQLEATIQWGVDHLTQFFTRKEIIAAFGCILNEHGVYENNFINGVLDVVKMYEKLPPENQDKETQLLVQEAVLQLLYWQRVALENQTGSDLAPSIDSQESADYLLQVIQPLIETYKLSPANVMHPLVTMISRGKLLTIEQELPTEFQGLILSHELAPFYSAIMNTLEANLTQR